MIEREKLRGKGRHEERVGRREKKKERRRKKVKES